MTDPGRIDSIVGEWLESRDLGESLDPEDVISLHPEMADELRRRFAALALLEEARDEARSLRRLPEDRYGDYEVAGEGGMGIVYWALDTDLNRQVAFKIVKPQGDGGGEAPSAPLLLAPPGKDTPASKAFETLKARFLQEAWVTAGLEHPGIVPVYELGETAEGVPYYTMRFVRGSRTLAGAIEEAADIDERLALLEPFLKVCDTIRYAHAHGVIHRDLKPENVAIGEFGEVVVLDWGLAKLKGQEDAAAEVWQERLEEFREAADLRTVAGALGTPGYMSLEAALGEVDNVDERSDVYSLGAMLYQLLTGKLPHTFTSYGQMVGVMLEETPVPAHEVDPQIPVDLSMICASALAREKAARFASAGDLAEALRRWQRESAVAREVRELLAKAEAAFEGTEGQKGEALLKQIDRVTAACSRIQEKASGHARAGELVEACESLRSRAIAETARAGRKRLLVRGGGLVLVLAVLAAIGVVWVVEGKRKETEAARADAVAERDRAEAERDAKEVSLRHARALALVSASALEDSHDTMCALLLAREAARLELTPAVQMRLHGAVVASRERMVLQGHDERVVSAVYSPSGDRILTASADKTARLWDLEGREVAVLRGHAGELRSAVFSPAAKRILTASEDKTARLWDLKGREVAVLRGHEYGVKSAVFSPTGKRILTASFDGTARLWDLEGREIAVLRGHDGPVRSAVFSPTGDRILTASMDKTARLWDLEGTEIAVLRGHIGEVWTASFSPACDRILTASNMDGTARLWDLEGRELTVLGSPGDPRKMVSVFSAVFSPSGDRILTAWADFWVSPEGTAHLWDLEGKEIAVFRGHLGLVTSAVFSPGGDRILTASEDETARLWDLTGREIAVLRGHDWQVTSAVFSPSGDRILTASADKTARLWDPEGKEGAILRGHKGDVQSASFSPSGERILTRSSEDKTVRLWDLEGKETAVLRGHESEAHLYSVVFSPVGDRILTASGDKTARVWDLEGEEIAVLRGHIGQVNSAAFSPAADRILTTSYDKTARLWDREGRGIAVLRAHDGWVNAAVLSPRGDRILTASQDKTARLWDLEGREIAVLRGHEHAVRSAVFSPTGDRILTVWRDNTTLWDREGSEIAVLRGHFGSRFSPVGDLIITVSEDTTARLWDPEGREIAVLRGHERNVRSVSISPAGDRILTASDDKTARLWDLMGHEIAVLRGHDEWVRSALFSPTGDRILTASDDKTARLWDLKGQEIAILRGHTGGVNSAVFSPRGDRIVTASEDETARIWLVHAEDLVRLAEERTTRDFTPEERRLYGDLLGLPAEDHDD